MPWNFKISGVIFLVKKSASVITGKEVTFKDETNKVMQSTANYWRKKLIVMRAGMPALTHDEGPDTV